MADLEISIEQAQAALEKIPAAQREALEAAAARVRSYHEHQNKNRGRIPKLMARY
jgi:histidinol dehydrogenase